MKMMMTLFHDDDDSSYWLSWFHPSLTHDCCTAHFNSHILVIKNMPKVTKNSSINCNDDLDDDDNVIMMLTG